MARKYPTIEINGLKVEVRSVAECEDADLVVCADESLSAFPDNVHTTCAWCTRPIVHRPYVPKRPPKVCLDCMRMFTQAEAVQ